MARVSRVLLVAVFLILIGTQLNSPARAQGANLLKNPGFEGNYTAFNGDSTKLVALDWSAWNLSKQPGDPSYVIDPEFRVAANRTRIKSGASSQEFFGYYGVFTGGIYQQVNVNSGTQVQFSAFVNVWSSGLDNAEKSEQPSRVSVEVGIDPLGGTDGASQNIVWSGLQSFYDEYRQLSVSATANGNVITVFVRASFPDPVAHNHVYVDDAALVATGQGNVTPVTTEVPATNTALPTGTAVPPTVPPTATTVNVPTREGSVTVVAPTTAATTPAATVATAGASVSPTVTSPAATVTGSGTPSGVPANLPGRAVHIVQPGDTVGALAILYNSTEAAIIAANGLNSNGFIVIGQQLIIPIPAQPTPAATQVIPTGSSPVEFATLTGPTVNGIGTYIVQPGDTMDAIARRYRISIRALANLNGIVNPDSLVIGQVLAVPGPGNNVPGGTIAPTVLPTSQPTSAPRIHTVAPGENLYRIALRYNVSLEAIMQANGLFDPNRIFVGQVLLIP